MRDGYKLTLSVLTIMILITITIGTSYSYYSVSAVQTEPNVVEATCFDISYTDSDVIKMNTAGNYMYPMSEATALTKVVPYKFTITNTCSNTNANTGTHFIVTLNTLTNVTSNLTPYLKYKLNMVAPTTFNGDTADLTARPYELGSAIKSEQGIDTSYTLATGELAPGESKSYQLYLWINEGATTDIMGYGFTGKVLIYSYL